MKRSQSKRVSASELTLATRCCLIWAKLPKAALRGSLLERGGLGLGRAAIVRCASVILFVSST